MSRLEKLIEAIFKYGAKAFGFAQKEATEISNIRQELERESDDELLAIASNDSSWKYTYKQKAVASAILKRRGYSPEDIKADKA